MTRWYADAEALFQMLEQWPLPVEFCEYLRSIDMASDHSKNFLVSWNRGRDRSLEREMDVRLQLAAMYDYGKLLVSLCYASEADTPRAHLVFQQWQDVYQIFLREIIDTKDMSDGQVCELRFGANVEATIRYLKQQGGDEASMRRKVIAIVRPVRKYMQLHAERPLPGNTKQFAGDMVEELELYETARLLDPAFIISVDPSSTRWINLLQRFRFADELNIDLLRRELPAYQQAATDNPVETTDDWSRFWQQNSTKFPHWSELANIVALMPSSSAASERVFGMLRHIFNEQATNLSDRHLEAQLKGAYNNREVQSLSQPRALAMPSFHNNFAAQQQLRA